MLTYSDGKLTASMNAGVTNSEGNWENHYFWAGINAAYRLNDQLTVKAGYTFYKYDEDNNGDVNNYNANGAFVGLRYQF